MVTREMFIRHTRREPQDDDLERCNCSMAGQIGHWCCGWNEQLMLPQFDIGPRMKPRVRVKAWIQAA